MFQVKTIHARNVNDAFVMGLDILHSPSALQEESRNGRVYSWPGPVVIQTANSLERVLFNPLRDANPFFHLFESLWMLAGRQDLPWLAQFNARMSEYSDDEGKTQPAAYGHRWRNYFGVDQLDYVVEELRRNPESRRVVLTMWDPYSDPVRVEAESADVPCNTQCYFRIHDRVLYMAVTCRSNDAVWGAHGANAVHFSILQEYIAAKVGAGCGGMTQFSWNYHVYPHAVKHSAVEFREAYQETYEHPRTITPSPLFGSAHRPDVADFDENLKVFMDWAEPGQPLRRPPILDHHFLRRTAMPMLGAWRARKDKDYPLALNLADTIEGKDWRHACVEWLKRRAK